MNTLGWIILALIVGFLMGESSGKHNTYKIIIMECRRLGGFFYGRTVIKCASVEDLPEITPRPMLSGLGHKPPYNPNGLTPLPDPVRPAPPMPHIPQPKPETRG